MEDIEKNEIDDIEKAEEPTVGEASTPSNPEDVKQTENVDDNLRKAVKEKNSIIHSLKDENAKYQQELEELKKQIEEKKREEDADPFLDYSEKKTPKLENKVKELEQRSKELSQKIKQAEVEKQVKEIDAELMHLKEKYGIDDKEATDLLVEAYRKTSGNVRDLSIFEDLLLARKAREERSKQSRNNLATESPTNGSPEIDKRPRTIEEAFNLLRRRRKT